MRVSLYVETLGQGPSLALLHGWGLHGGIWHSVRAALAQRFTLHIIDLPGHGYSQQVEADSLAAIAYAVEAVLPPQCHVCGWSFGGLVALHIAATRPERIHKLVLVSTTPCFVQREDWLPGLSAAVLNDFAARLKADYRRTLLNFLSLQVRSDARARALLRDLREVLLARGEPNPDALSAGLRMLQGSDLRALVAHIDHSALVIHGERDTLTPRAAGDWLAQHLPDALYSPFQQCAHAPFLSHPERFVATLGEFLDGK